MTDFASHRQQIRLENAQFLLSMGMHPDLVARRLGITRESLDRMFERKAHGDRDTEPPTRAGEAP